MPGEVYETIQVVQMFVLGRRLIVGVRECHAKLVAYSDEGNGIASIVSRSAYRLRLAVVCSAGMLAAVCSHSPGPQ